MTARSRSRVRRPRHPMASEILEALQRRDLLIAYSRRPPYQRNDYLGRITRAKTPETREKRLAQMLDELAGGDRYMSMPYRART